MPNQADEQISDVLTCPNREVLADFALGKLSASRLEAIGRHASNCAACSDELDRLPRWSDPLLVVLRQAAQPALAALHSTEAHARHAASDAGTHTSSPPTKLGSFEIVGELERGGMGIVYKAVQPGLNRLVAIKALPAAMFADARAIQRFRMEAQALSRLQHPHIVQIFDYGEHEGRPYLAMEYVAGRSLAEMLCAVPLPVRDAAEMLRKLAQAVQYAHEQNVLHRDLRPSNVLIGPGSVKLTDFGLARLADKEGLPTTAEAHSGTASYLAPEQAQASPSIGPTTDVHGLGAILYEMLTGRAPFRGQTRLETLELVQHAPPERPSRLREGIPPDLEAICLKCLEKDPRDRYPSVTALLADLDRWLQGDAVLAGHHSWLRTRRGRRWAIACGVLLALAAALGAIVYWRGSLGN